MVVYWLLPRRPRQLFLFAASVTFYGFWRFDYVFIMLASAFTDFFAAINIHNAKAPARRRLWLALSLAVNFGLLFYFKYANFIVGNINGLAHLIGRDDLLATWSVVLPVGISFYTFQTVSYTVDVYRGRIEPIREPLLYGLFVTFFVHLVAGPILRAAEVIPQLDRRKLFNVEFLAAGLWLILNGLFLKCVLADNIGGYVDEGFGANPTTLSATDVWVLAVLFGFQIYFDFAAYSQIAIGSATTDGRRSFPRTSFFPTSPHRRAISGGAGTSRCRAGSGIISICRCAACVRMMNCAADSCRSAIRWAWRGAMRRWLPPGSSWDCGTEQAGPLRCGACGTRCSSWCNAQSRASGCCANTRGCAACSVGSSRFRP